MLQSGESHLSLVCADCSSDISFAKSRQEAIRMTRLLSSMISALSSVKMLRYSEKYGSSIQPRSLPQYLQHAFWGTTPAFNLLDFGLQPVAPSCLRQGLVFGAEFLLGQESSHVS
jgi:hypothetical protein